MKVEVEEDSSIVFIYHKKPRTLNGEYVCNNYIHPLFNLDGDVLTEEFPPDHPFHRGIFWAWHQLYVNDIRLGDGWTNDSIAQDVVNVRNELRKESVLLKLDVQWRSLVYGGGKPFMDEKTTITVHKLDSCIRKIDFEITLRALVRGLQVGGSADEKGYGGFCIRLRIPDSLIFTSENGPVTPQLLQVEAGPWMDFSGRFGLVPVFSGVTIIRHPDMPDYSSPWILRQKGSMQNTVYPGRERISIPVDKPVVLRYRILIHKGDAGRLNMIEQQEDYAKRYNNR